MIEKTKIEKLVEEYISGTGLFLVAVKVSSAGKITVLADKKEGITIDECVGISRAIEKTFSRDVEDYELQVSSPGLEMPFLVIQQYYKNEGKRIEVVDSEGMKYYGILKNVNAGGFELEAELKGKNKGKSKSVEPKELSFNYDQVKSAREVVTFK
jgi:ribosome maturation factor RimP